MEDAFAAYQTTIHRRDQLLSCKVDHYKNLLRCGQINIPDKKLQEVYNWTKINTEWLVADMEGTGRFLGAGAIEYPWLFGCDNSYAIQGVVATGNIGLAEETLKVIKNESEKANGNGRILHEMAFNGFVSNKGNTQETAHFIVAVYEVFKWSGNLEFIKELYPYMKKGVEWLLGEQDQNKNMFPEGYGIMEVQGLNAELIDVAVYTQQALVAMSEMSKWVGDSDEVSDHYRLLSEKSKTAINEKFWDAEKQMYCDFYGTKQQALKTTKGAIKQLETAAGNSKRVENDQMDFYNELYKQIEKYPDNTEKGWLTNINWVISTPIETGIAPVHCAFALLDRVRNDHCGEHGPFLSVVEKRRHMTISTGVQAVAEAKYGRIDHAMEYVDMIVATFGRTLPGSISEMMPDYGCPAQAWTIYGIAVPLIKYVFGINPDAYRKTIVVKPNPPRGWSNFSFSNMAIGDNTISFSYEEKEGAVYMTLKSKNKDWSFEVDNEFLGEKKVMLNGTCITGS